jgi:lipopolysaccharide transport system ATP-binding protein
MVEGARKDIFMSDHALRVEHLSKHYTIGKYRHDMLSDLLGHWIKRPFSLNGEGSHKNESTRDFWALKDVCFEVKNGEVVGIIGRNGAGKSTLLKILSRITQPTRGRVEIHGRVGSLLEVGTGFHPELTGRDNIYLSGAILGMKKAEIARKFDEIVAFSEIEQFIDTPVKRYSSGMYTRLAFAVAAHLEPEILIVDEVLAVGDSAFQKKCLGKIKDVAGHEKTVLFVSHNMAVVQALCQRGILLSGGTVVVDAAAADAVRAYCADLAHVVTQPLEDRRDRQGSGQLRFTEFWIEDNRGRRIDRVLVGDDVRFCLAYKAASQLHDVEVSFNLFETIGDLIIDCNSDAGGCNIEVAPEEGVFVCEIKKFPLTASRYGGNVWCKANGHVADFVRDAIQVDVEDGDFYGSGRPKAKSKVLIPYNWNVRA